MLHNFISIDFYLYKRLLPLTPLTQAEVSADKVRFRADECDSVDLVYVKSQFCPDGCSITVESF